MVEVESRAMMKFHLAAFVVILYAGSSSRWTCEGIRVRADSIREDHKMISYRGDGIDPLDSDELEDQRMLEFDANGKRSTGASGTAGADASGAKFIDIPSFKPHDIPVRSLYEADGLDPTEEIIIDKDADEDQQEREIHVRSSRKFAVARRRRQIDDKPATVTRKKRKPKAKACSSVLRYWAGCNM